MGTPSAEQRDETEEEPVIRLRDRVKTLAPATAAVAAVALLAGQAPAQAAPLSGWFMIQNKTSELCVDLPAHLEAWPGAPVSQYKCDSSRYDNQRWVFRPQGQVTVKGKPYNKYLIVNGRSRLCLDVPDTGAKGDGTRVSQFECARRPADDNQEWYVVTRRSAGRQGVWIVNEKSRKCLDVQDQGRRDEAPLTLFTCSDAAAEDHYWRISKHVRP